MVQRFVLHVDPFDGVLCCVPVDGDDQGDRLPHVPHFPVCQGLLLVLLERSGQGVAVFLELVDGEYQLAARMVLRA